jgi:transcriptional regulator with XRE-family HTH domain
MRKKSTSTPDLKATILERFTISEFSRRTRIERTQIYQILNRQTLPGLEKFVAMAGALELPLEEVAELLGVPKDGKAFRK